MSHKSADLMCASLFVCFVGSGMVQMFLGVWVISSVLLGIKLSVGSLIGLGAWLIAAVLVGIWYRKSIWVRDMFNMNNK